MSEPRLLFSEHLKASDGNSMFVCDSKMKSDSQKNKSNQIFSIYHYCVGTDGAMWSGFFF